MVMVGYCCWWFAAGGLLSRSRKLSKSITGPIEDLSARVKVISAGDLTQQPVIQANELEVQALSEGFEQMVTHLNELIAKNKKKRSTGATQNLRYCRLRLILTSV